MGTVELTGLEMMQSMALGHASAHAATRLRTIEPLVLKRSSRVMPGLRGTPAGITTTCFPQIQSAWWVREQQWRCCLLALAG